MKTSELELEVVQSKTRVTRMVSRAHDENFLMSSMKSYLRKEFEQGWVHYYEPYEEVHNENLIKVYGHYKNKQLPSFSES